MYKSAEEANNFVEEVKGKLPVSDRVEAIVCAPALYLTQLKDLAEGSSLTIGAQTMHFEKEGAFTGETSPAMLSSVGVNYVILGHSERREYYNETDQSVNQKVLAAFEYDLTPIVCVGETLEERESNTTVEKVAHQVKEAFNSVGETEAAKAVIAYEPIWAIGTGKTATAEIANETCGYIRFVIEREYGKEVSEHVRIQYGGSVKPGNIKELMAQEHIDGALVGGASLDADSFLQLVNFNK